MNSKGSDDTAEMRRLVRCFSGHIHLSKKVTATSRFLQAGMTTRDNIHVYILEQNLKSGYIRIQFMLLATVISGE